jgi:competence protein CoiA
MLTALFDQQPFTTIHYTKEELMKLRESSPHFICPHCSSPLILRLGNIKIPHFAHTSKISCAYGSKKETSNHVLGKAILYQRLSQLFDDVKLEYYVKELHQIPDLLITVKEERVAVEVQCSTIPLSEVKDRSDGFRREKIQPLWLLSQPVISKIPLKLTCFQQGFIRFSPELHYFLLHFDPERKYFTVFPHLTPVTTNSFLLSKPIIIPLQRFTIPISISPPECPYPHILKNWHQYRQQWMQNKINYSSSRYDRFLGEVYEEGDTFIYLPKFIGLPVIPHAALCKTHPVEWQYYMWKDVMKKYRHFTMEMINHAFLRRVSKGDIELRELPLLSGASAMKNLIHDYLELLEKIDVIKKGEGKYYRLSFEWKSPKTFNEFQQHERDFFPKWKHILKKD